MKMLIHSACATIIPGNSSPTEDAADFVFHIWMKPKVKQLKNFPRWCTLIRANKMELNIVVTGGRGQG
jgi:hypothetical protein